SGHETLYDASHVPCGDAQGRGHDEFSRGCSVCPGTGHHQEDTGLERLHPTAGVARGRPRSGHWLVVLRTEGPTLATAAEFLMARDVSFQYTPQRGMPAPPVLVHFTLALTEGEFFCLLGPSGCGKTTVLNLMAGFLQPTTGRLTLADHPIHGPGVDRAV